MVDQICMDKILLDSAKEVFETMIFMGISEASDQTDTIKGDTFLGNITFKGEMEGCLGITLAENCAKAVAANMLCLEPDEEISDADLADAIGEVANMVMGSVKTRIQDTVSNIELSIPTVICGRILKSNMGDGFNKTVIQVKVDDYDAELSFSFRSGS